MIRLVAVVIALAGFSRAAAAQDPVKVDPTHHKVELENARVRVLRVTLEPGAKTPVHEHPAGVVTFLTDAKLRVTRSEESQMKHPGRPRRCWNSKPPGTQRRTSGVRQSS